MMESDLRQLGEWMAGKLSDELILQGHYISPGGLSDDIDVVVRSVADKSTIELWMRDYAGYLERGVKAENIPFSGVTGRGGKSAYIEGLRRWAERRGMDNPLSAAFAIAHTHKKEGMPTIGSRRMGKKTEFLSDAIKKNSDEIEQRVAIITQGLFEVELDNLLKRIQDGSNDS